MRWPKRPPAPLVADGIVVGGGPDPHRAWVLGAVFVGALLLALSPVGDGDIFWHLAAGREMVRRHDWLWVDPFTVSAAGRPWADVHWLFQLGATGVHHAFGLVGLVAVKAALVALGATSLIATVGRRTGVAGMSLAAAGLLAALFLARHALVVRPIVVTLVMLALFFAVLDDFSLARSRRLLVLPLAQVVWANCQGLSALGPALVGAYLLGALMSPAARRRGWPFAPETNAPRGALALTFALCLGAMLATPYGLRGALLPGHLLSRLVPVAGNVFSAEVAENVPPLVLLRSAPDQVAHFPWYLLGLGGCLFLARERLRLSSWLTVLGFGALAFLANRNVLLFYWLATPIAAGGAALPLRAWVVRRFGRTNFGHARAAARVGAAAILGGELVLAGVSFAREAPLDQPAPFHFPVRSAAILRNLGATGPVFAPDHQGGYLSFTAPSVTPYIDTRLTLHTATEYAAYLRAVDHPPSFDTLDAAVHFRYVVLTTDYPDRYLALAQHLAADVTWRLVDTDGAELLFAREGEALALGQRPTTKAIVDALNERFAATPSLNESALLRLARLMIVVEQPDEARHVLSTLSSPVAAQLRARAHFVAGELAAAETLSRALVGTDAQDVRSLALLARVAFVAGRADAGIAWLRRALDVDPRDLEARALLDEIEARHGGVVPGGGPVPVRGEGS